MGQKANLLTLRKVQKNLSFQGNEKESKKFLYGLKFLSFFEQLLSQKNIILTDRTLNFVNNEIFLNLSFLFKTTKLKNYKKIYQNNIKISKNRNHITKFFLEEFKIFKNNCILLNLRIINKEINEKIGKIFYNKTKRFIKILLSRRFNLFADFIKATSLFCENKIFIQAYLTLIAQIFRVLRKNTHSRFLLFLRELLHLLTITNNGKRLSLSHNIKGAKFLINGKLRGKTRSSSSCVQVGSVPIQSLGKKISFAKIHVYTLYGIFGFRLWIHRD